MEKLEKFCYTCGSLLRATPFTWAYDTQTGKPKQAYNYECPKKKWFSLGHAMTESEAYALQAG